MKRIRAVASLTVLLSAMPHVAAQEKAAAFAPPGDESANFASDPVLTDLDSPAALAIRAASSKDGPHELFIAESGAGRLVKLATNQPEQAAEVVTGLALNSIGDQSDQQFRPAGLAFLTRSKLAVGGAGQDATKGTISVYSLPEDGSVLTADQLDHTAGPVKAGDSSASDQAVFFGFAQTDAALYSTWSDTTAGWILKSAIEANRLAYLQPLASPKLISSLGPPTGIAIIPSPRPPFLVVAHMGTLDTPQDSSISFFVPSSATLAMSLDTGLHDIVALAYSPTGQMYVADIAWNEPQSGGIFRIDDAIVDGQQACRAVKIAAVLRPTSLAFAPDGALYVTSLGEGDKQGSIIKITGEL